MYRDIGDYLKREEKLTVLRDAASIAGIEDWRTITPDQHHDWVSQRSDAFQRLYPMGAKTAKAGKATAAIFKLFSNGYKTGRDVYVYNFSRAASAENARKMVDDYLAALGRTGSLLKSRVQRRTPTEFSDDHVREVAYRPEQEVICLDASEKSRKRRFVDHSGHRFRLTQY